MRVVLDTNIIYRSGRRQLLGAEVDLIDKSRQKLNIKIFVPDVVIEELRCIYSEDYRHLCKHVEKLSRLLLDESERPKLAPAEKALENYIIASEDRMSKLGITKVSHDKIGHTWILDRIFSRRRPFSDSGKRRPDSSKGYRDSLIWEIICRKVGHKDEKTIFITDNWQDFAESKTNNCMLHPHLINDLKKLGLPEDTVVLCPSLEDFNRQYVKPELTKLDDIKKEIENDTCPYFNLASFFRKNFDDIFKQVQDNIDDEEEEISELLGEDLSEVYLSSMYGAYDSRIAEVRKLSDTEILLLVEMEAEAEIEFFLFKNVAYALDDDSRINIYDYDWNEWMAEAGACICFSIELDIILDCEKSEISNFDVLDVTPVAS